MCSNGWHIGKTETMCYIIFLEIVEVIVLCLFTFASFLDVLLHLI